MNARTPLRLIALAALAALTGGCFLWAPNLDPIRREMQATTPGVHLDAGVQLHFGRLSLALARRIARAAADDEEERQVADLLRHVNGVEVAVYEVKDIQPGERQLWEQKVARLGEHRGWQLAARFRDEDSVGSVHFALAGAQIRSIWIFVLDDEELVMARLRGHLDRALADAIAATGREIPDSLTHRARTERPDRPAAAEAPAS
jgi:Domain of unknown function (DUF4252)